MKRALMVLGLLAIVAVPAYAAEVLMKADIPFEFVAGGKTLPAGNYEFIVNEQRSMVTLRNLQTNKSMLVTIVTELAAQPGLDARITFDSVGEKKMLEAIWPADMGFLLHTTKGKHSHEIVNAAAKK